MADDDTQISKTCATTCSNIFNWSLYADVVSMIAPLVAVIIAISSSVILGLGNNEKATTIAYVLSILPLLGLAAVSMGLVIKKTLDGHQSDGKKADEDSSLYLGLTVSQIAGSLIFLVMLVITYNMLNNHKSIGAAFKSIVPGMRGGMQGTETPATAPPRKLPPPPQPQQLPISQADSNTMDPEVIAQAPILKNNTTGAAPNAAVREKVEKPNLAKTHIYLFGMGLPILVSLLSGVSSLCFTAVL